MYDRIKNSNVVVIEDDKFAAASICYILETRAGCTVRHFADPREALAALMRDPADIIISDVRLPGMDGLEFIKRLRLTGIATPVVMSTSFATLDLAVQAVRVGASAFLQKPVSRSELLGELDRAMASSPASSRTRVLAVGAHPDDVEIGVGGTLAMHAAAGDQVTILTLSRGDIGGEPSLREVEARAAAELIGAELILGDLEDTKIEERGAAVELIERAVAAVEPDIVYTHSINDVHQDHRSTHHAVLVAARNVPSILCFQSPSATVGFRPTRFISVDAHIERKLELIAAHRSQADTRGYLDPDLIRSTARYWGRFAGSALAEPLEVERERQAKRVRNAA